MTELINIIVPFAEATDDTHGDGARIGFVVPTVVAMHTVLHRLHTEVPHQP